VMVPQPILEFSATTEITKLNEFTEQLSQSR